MLFVFSSKNVVYFGIPGYNSMYILLFHIQAFCSIFIMNDFSNVPVLFMMEMNHLRLVDGEISSSIHIKQGNTKLIF